MTYMLSTVFCDDIRFENNGKMLLIGVYKDDLIPGLLPQTLPLSVWSRLSGIAEGTYDITVRAGVNDISQHELRVRIEIQSSNHAAHIQLVGVPIQIDAPSKVFIEVAGLPSQDVLKSFLEIQPVQDLTKR